MKNNFSKILVAGMAFVMMLSSCVKDLDTVPLNETDFTSESAYADEASYLRGLTYINGYWVLVGQSDPGTADITAPDAGQSELLRQFINLNEMSVDSYKCVWGDSYIASLSNQTWSTADNQALITVYTRCMKGIALVNEYLLQTEDDRLDARGQNALKDKVHGFRAEARFHRAMYYWVLLDLFGNPPFAMPENIGGDLPLQKKRADLYAWLETELLELVADGSAMPAKGAVAYPRPTQGSVWALLSRLYLNAEVYTGTAEWQKAKDAAASVIGMGYTLHSKYQELFMQDNTTNGATEEMIFAIAYDKDQTESWGGTTTMMSAALNEAANMGIATELGITAGKINVENWAGYHVAPDYVARFQLSNVTWGGANGFGYDRATSDKRAFFYNIGNSEEFSLSDMATGWFCWKFSGLKSDGTVVLASEDNSKFSSADFPIFRLAEMYLTYAEAEVRLGGLDAIGYGYIKALRDRAGVATPVQNDITLDWLLDERSREMMWEGQRRIDLIRFGKFTDMNFPWAFKGGVPNGKVSLPAYRTIYPIIQSDLAANPNLVQNPGY